MYITTLSTLNLFFKPSSFNDLSIVLLTSYKFGKRRLAQGRKIRAFEGARAPLNTKEHPLIAESTPSKLKKVIKHFITKIQQK